MARHEIIGVRERPEFESLLQWLRLSFLLSPLLALASSGPSAGAYALSIAVAVAASYAWIALLLRFKPGLLLRLQLLLRAVDCVLVYMVAVQRRDAMLAGVTHDPRSPLSVIKLEAQLRRRRGDERLATSVDLIDRAATRMARWIDELLEVASARSAEDLELKLGTADLVAVVREAVEDYQQTIDGTPCGLRPSPSRSWAPLTCPAWTE